MREDYQVVDLIKFICCCFIIMLHTEGLSFLNSALYEFISQALFRIAVPFFFVTSGFLLSRKLLDSSGNYRSATEIQDACHRYVKRLALPLFVFEIINITLEIIRLYTANSFNISQVKNIIKRFIFYPYGALWYVQACIVAVFLIYFTMRWKKLWGGTRRLNFVSICVTLQ